MPTTDRARTRRGVTAAVAAVLLVFTPVEILASTSPPDSETADSTPTTTPATEPEATAPDTTAPDTTTGEGTTGTDATTLTWITIIAAIGLLGIAVWWMVRSNGRSGPVSRMDDDWPGDSEVI
jgi:hypothetical protein